MHCMNAITVNAFKLSQLIDFNCFIMFNYLLVRGGKSVEGVCNAIFKRFFGLFGFGKGRLGRREEGGRGRFVKEEFLEEDAETKMVQQVLIKSNRFPQKGKLIFDG